MTGTEYLWEWFMDDDREWSVAAFSATLDVKLVFQNTSLLLEIVL